MSPRNVSASASEARGRAGCDSSRASEIVGFLGSDRLLLAAEQAFAARVEEDGNESFESRFLCTSTTLCFTTDLWRTDIQVLVYVLENGVRHVARATQTAAHEKSAMVPGESKKSQSQGANANQLYALVQLQETKLAHTQQCCCQSMYTTCTNPHRPKHMMTRASTVHASSIKYHDYQSAPSFLMLTSPPHSLAPPLARLIFRLPFHIFQLSPSHLAPGPRAERQWPDSRRLHQQRELGV